MSGDRGPAAKMLRVQFSGGYGGAAASAVACGRRVPVRRGLWRRAPGRWGVRDRARCGQSGHSRSPRSRKGHPHPKFPASDAVRPGPSIISRPTSTAARVPPGARELLRLRAQPHGALPSGQEPIIGCRRSLQAKFRSFLVEMPGSAPPYKRERDSNANGRHPW